MNRSDDPIRMLDSKQVIFDEASFMDWVFAERSGPEAVWYLNPYTLAHLREGHLMTAQSDWVVADGHLMAQAMSQGLGRPCESLHFDFSGPASRVFNAMVRRGARLGVIGGKPGEASTFRRIVEQRFPGLDVVFADDGYFPISRRASTAKRIAATRPDVLLVAMGSPRQEEFAHVLGTFTDHPMAVISCGAFVSQAVMRREHYYPGLIVKLNLRWLYRLYLDPRMFTRIIKYYVPYKLRMRRHGPDLPFRDT